jgi:hypothetical protein
MSPNEQKLFDIAREITEETMGPPLKVGETVRHPDGRLVQIVDGQFWGEDGLSNFWTWREVLADGTLGAPEKGYGWQREADADRIQS